ncbi:MAG: protein-export chaperone SecB [Gammaproteobacteria bacterium]|nr:protein-export chaperone SecB [Gammaproteobacteria bacterium]
MTKNTTPSNLELKKVYIKDVSFESPNAPLIFTQTGGPQPTIDMQVAMENSLLEDNEDFYEVVLKVTITAKTDDNVAFLVEVEQAGVFLLQHAEEEKMNIMKEVACPHILLPFAREEINSLVTKGGFQPLLISPINFEALYMRKLNENTTESQPEQAESSTTTH